MYPPLPAEAGCESRERIILLLVFKMTYCVNFKLSQYTLVLLPTKCIFLTDIVTWSIFVAV